MVSSLVPNAYISEVILTAASDMESSFDVPRTELDSHANMVVLGLNSFVFESTDRTCNFHGNVEAGCFEVRLR